MWLASLLLIVASSASGAPAGPRLPDATLTDQDGQPRRIRELARDGVVAFNFIFTSCATICQPMSATFGRVQGLLRDPHARLVSVSIDPETDTPARLHEWAERFRAGPRWTLLTGRPSDVDALRRALGVYTPDRQSHAPTVVILNAADGRIVRTDGLGSAHALAETIDALAEPEPAPAAPGPAASYFSGLPLVDQDGRRLDLYEDVLRGHVVVIQSFFASCQGSCPVTTGNLLRLQARFADDMGQRLRLVSISVDPEHDTPAALQAHAARVGARPGWLFLSGTRAQVDAALAKLGLSSETREAHKDLLLIGNEPTGLWKKAMGLSAPGALGDIVESVLDDPGD